ncbi:unnamed protein product [Urochloa humidicola]
MLLRGRLIDNTSAAAALSLSTPLRMDFSSLSARSQDPPARSPSAPPSYRCCADRPATIVVLYSFDAATDLAALHPALQAPQPVAVDAPGALRRSTFVRNRKKVKLKR